MKKLLGLLFAILLPFSAFADDICWNGILPMGNNKSLCSRSPATFNDLPLLTMNTSGDLVLNAPVAGRSAILQVAGTTVASFSSTGSTIPPLITTDEAVAGAGTTVSDAAALSGTKYVHQLTGANGTVGWKFVTATPVGSVQLLLNTTAGVPKIYGEAGSTCNGGATDAACTLLSGIVLHACFKRAALTYICS